ncbi:hypothetical protein GMOD_00004093 [Pyrenophora seminiperda CCB06]|uniref:Uncharacterized protein n=1 Tax=Pyrenophora seminiperda CCB06 TaxID=1302712 RepID=A0A3M7M0R6_9PLEO|nr:hypothetical protein GMOD_00004093 [Pyrenophora seminiperda CCB06]
MTCLARTVGAANPVEPHGPTAATQLGTHDKKAPGPLTRFKAATARRRAGQILTFDYRNVDMTQPPSPPRLLTGLTTTTRPKAVSLHIDSAIDRGAGVSPSCPVVVERIRRLIMGHGQGGGNSTFATETGRRDG